MPLALTLSSPGAALAADIEVESDERALTVRVSGHPLPLVRGQALPGWGQFDLIIDFDMDGDPEFEMRPGWLQNVRARAWYAHSHTAPNRMPTFTLLKLWPHPTPDEGPPSAVITRMPSGTVRMELDVDHDGAVDAEAETRFGW